MTTGGAGTGRLEKPGREPAMTSTPGVPSRVPPRADLGERPKWPAVVRRRGAWAAHTRDTAMGRRRGRRGSGSAHAHAAQGRAPTGPPRSALPTPQDQRQPAPAPHSRSSAGTGTHTQGQADT